MPNNYSNRGDSKNQDPRDIAVRILTAIAPDFQYSDRHINSELDRLGLSKESKNRVVFLVKGTIQWRDKLDLEIQKFVKRKVDKLPTKLINILRVAAFQLFFNESFNPSQTVNETVNLIKKALPPFVGLANAVLRKIAAIAEEERARVDDNTNLEEIEDLAVLAANLSHPQWLIKRFIERYGKKEAIELAKYNNNRWPVTIWLNTQKDEALQTLTELEKLGITTTESNYLKNTYLLDSKKSVDFKKLKSFNDGLFHIIDESSALIALLLNPHKTDEVLDLCAAPGGKTSIISQLMENEGDILATDRSEKRLELIDENVLRLNLKNIIISQADGTTNIFDKSFDKILIDAPCSGTGVIGRKVDMKWNRNEDQFKEMNDIQIRLLNNAKKYLKPNGSIIYSTCSLEEEENEQIIERFLFENKDFKLIDFDLDPKFIKESCQQLFTTGKFLRTVPHRHKLGGMFAARLVWSAELQLGCSNYQKP